mmetsp:Transcript_26022/g.29781  ORF Transcript_26022/g.29781 Transcript_26022/m.29781 type:complete len:494 (+) Transcript_26022:40-1521(+)
MEWSKPKCLNDAPGCRAAHSCDIVGSILYIFGGWNGKKALNDMHMLDTFSMRWSVVQKTPTTPGCRNNHTTVSVNHLIYVHGGHDGDKWLNDLHVFDTKKEDWFTPELKGKLPSARACHTLSYVNNKLYMFGGYDGETCFFDIEVLDLDTYTWTQVEVSGKVPLARNAHTMTVLGTKLYLFGGHSGNIHLRDLHIFDTGTLTWLEPEITGTITPKGLRGHTASLIRNRILFFGGYDGKGRSKDLYILNLEQLSWSHPEETDKTPLGRQRHTAVAVGRRQLFVFGGFDGNNWLNDLYVLNVPRYELEEMKDESIRQLVTNLRGLVDDSTFSDVTFLIEEKKIHAHKAILSAQCEHFRAMFSSGMKESQETVISIDDWSHSAYHQMIEFLYTGTIHDLSPEQALDVLGLADAYTLGNLKVLCESILTANVSTENVCDYLMYAHQYSASDLQQSCFDYVVLKFEEVNETEGFERLKHFPNLLMDVSRKLFELSKVK